MTYEIFQTNLLQKVEFPQQNTCLQSANKIEKLLFREDETVFISKPTVTEFLCCFAVPTVFKEWILQEEVE